MNKKRIAFILAGLMTLNLLGSCSNSEDEEAQKLDDLISLVESEETSSYKKTFEEGKHIIQYLVDCEYDYYENDYEGYVPTVEIPNGYRYDTAFSTIERNGNGSKSGTIVFIFVNEVPVEADGLLDESGKVVYPNPGKPIENTLKLTPENN